MTKDNTDVKTNREEFKSWLVFVYVYFSLIALANIFSFWQGNCTVRFTNGPRILFSFSTSFSEMFSTMWALLISAIYALVTIKKKTRQECQDFVPVVTEYDMRPLVLFGMALNTLYLFRVGHLPIGSAIEHSLTVGLIAYSVFLFTSCLQVVGSDKT